MGTPTPTSRGQHGAAAAAVTLAAAVQATPAAAARATPAGRRHLERRPWMKQGGRTGDGSSRGTPRRRQGRLPGLPARASRARQKRRQPRCERHPWWRLGCNGEAGVLDKGTGQQS